MIIPYSQQIQETNKKLLQIFEENQIEVSKISDSLYFLKANELTIKIFIEENRWQQHCFGFWNPYIKNTSIQLKVSSQGEILNWCINSFNPNMEDKDIFEYLKIQKNNPC